MNLWRFAELIALKLNGIVKVHFSTMPAKILKADYVIANPSFNDKFLKA